LRRPNKPSHYNSITYKKFWHIKNIAV